MSDVFPLTALENMFVREDSPTSPMSCYARLRFSGVFDREPFEAAVRAALARHVLLTAMVKRVGGRDALVTTPPADLPIRWLPWIDGERFPAASHPDIRTQPGFRIDVFTGDGRTDLVMRYHHVSCDGIGAMTFLTDLLLAYAAAVGPAQERPAFRPLDEHLLPERGRMGVTFRDWRQVVRAHLAGLPGTWSYFRHSPQPVSAPCAQGPSDRALPPDYPAVVHRVLDGAATCRLTTAAERRHCTVNDVLIRDLFLALAELRAKHGVSRERDWLRLAIPVSLRTLRLRYLPAANVFGFAFLDRRTRDCMAPARLLESIHDDMRRVTRWGVTRIFISNLKWAQAFGGLVERARDRAGTCLFTNLGRIATSGVPLDAEKHAMIGTVVLEDIEMVVPPPPRVGIAIAALQYAGRLSLTAHYDSRIIAARTASDLVTGLVARLHESASEDGCD